MHLRQREEEMDYQDLVSRCEWIRSIKRLPDDGITVIVYVPECESDPVWFGYHEDDAWRWIDGSLIGGTVVAWRHLPDPPRA